MPMDQKMYISLEIYYIASLFFLSFWTSLDPFHVSETQSALLTIQSLLRKINLLLSHFPLHILPSFAHLFSLSFYPPNLQNSPASFPTSLPTVTFVLPSTLQLLLLSTSQWHICSVPNLF